MSEIKLKINGEERSVDYVQSDYSPPGLGEPPIAPATPALTNALFAASGKRVRSMPIGKEGLYI